MTTSELLASATALLDSHLPIVVGDQTFALGGSLALDEDGSLCADLALELKDAAGGVSARYEQADAVLVRGAARDPARALCALEGWVQALPAIIRQSPGAQLPNAAGLKTPDELVHPELLEAADVATTAQFSAWLLGPESPFPWLLRTPIIKPFEPYRGSLGPGVEPMYECLADQGSEAGWEWATYRVRGWPAAARTAYYLGFARARLGGGGFVVFLLNARHEDACGIYAAFEAAECDGLLELMKEALARMILDGSAVMLDGQRLYPLDDAAEEVDDPASWEDIDARLGGLLEGELGEKMASFAQKHWQVLSAP